MIGRFAGLQQVLEVGQPQGPGSAYLVAYTGSGWHDDAVVDIDELLPRSRSPRDYLDLVADPRVDQDVLRVLAASPYSFVR